MVSEIISGELTLANIDGRYHPAAGDKLPTAPIRYDPDWWRDLNRRANQIDQDPAQRSPCSAESAENTEPPEQAAKPQQAMGENSALSALSALHNAAITNSLPTGKGQYRERLFELCRRLKAIPELVNAKPPALRPIIVAWHQRALPFITATTFEKTWTDFLFGWKRVKQAAGDGVVEVAYRRALDREPPEMAAELYPGETNPQRLASLCRELQGIAGDAGSFFLDCRMAGRLLTVDPSTASRWLVAFCDYGILALVKKGTRPGDKVGAEGRKANEYRYIGDGKEVQS